jgi:fructose-bisphosphate aldolase class I
MGSQDLSSESKREQQLQRMQYGTGFIAALDQSGGSTPHALELYGVRPGEYRNDSEMFDLVHQMRTRIMTSPHFSHEHILATILFEDTVNRKINGLPTAQYLSEVKNIVPFMKIDLGLEAETNSVRLMKPMPQLDERLSHARSLGIFGTKMRSVINQFNSDGIHAIVEQQFDYANAVLNQGLIPIVEPEVNIEAPNKAVIETLLEDEIIKKLDALSGTRKVILKLTLPETPNFYLELSEHPQVVRVAALSGGYSRTHATSLLSANHKMIASFSRALTEGLSAQQSDEEFNFLLKSSIESIYRASSEAGKL